MDDMISKTSGGINIFSSRPQDPVSARAGERLSLNDELPGQQAGSPECISFQTPAAPVP
jgi:hypothetical protein